MPSFILKGSSHRRMVLEGLRKLNIPAQRKVVIKPNLIDNRPYPVTTPPKTVEGIVEYFRKKAEEIIIAEGSGWCRGGTNKAFEDLGYAELAEEYKVKLVDLNTDKYVVRRNKKAFILKEFEFPLTLKNSFLISVPVLKRHSITKVTLSLKNMLGATIGADKGRFHRLGIDECIVDINTYKRPDVAIIDGIKGCIGGELGGRTKSFKLMIFSTDALAADALGSKILGYNPLEVRHLVLAEEKGIGNLE